ncbi:MAG: NUDIX hydrolase [Deltaproteobacteria bacterium]|nr:NUDIX hydrolase [Deltaproteobacteria bacterium]
MGIFELRQRRLVAANSKFAVYFDDIDDGQGERVQDYLVVAPLQKTGNLVTGVAVLAEFEGKVALVRVYRHAVATRGWEIARGFLDANESEEAAALRELEEEMSMTCQKTHLRRVGYVTPEPGLMASRVALYVADGCVRLAGNRVPELGHSELRYFARAEIDVLIEKGEVQDPFTLVAYLRWRT